MRQEHVTCALERLIIVGIDLPESSKPNVWAPTCQLTIMAIRT